jgi:hypothetical protein
MLSKYGRASWKVKDDHDKRTTDLLRHTVPRYCVKVTQLCQSKDVITKIKAKI